MSDQDDLIQRLNPDPPASKPEPENPFPLDAFGIPILDDVVTPGTPPETEMKTREHLVATEEPTPPSPLETKPDYTILTADLKSSLLARLDQSLGQLSGELAERVASRLAVNLEGEIRQELQQLLEQRITAALDQELADEKNPPRPEDP